jgi:sulfur dioxygenase
MNPTQLFDPRSCTYTYLLFDEGTREALIIDPVDTQLERDLDAIARLELKLRWTVETHAHADHITSAAQLAELTGARMAAPAGCEVGTAAVQLKDGDTLRFGAETLHVLHTPGHTAGSVCFYWERGAGHAEDTLARGQVSRVDQRSDPRHVFSGDTLLIGGCGRTDFQSGDAGQLWDSITQVLFKLPGDTLVWPGHDYHERTQSTIALERATNPRLAGQTREAFIQLMGALNLPKPGRIDEAVPANCRSGLRQDAASAADAGGAEVTAATGYAGDITPATAHRWMENGQAVLVDVRTDAEREWVGFVPGAQAVAWKQWPGMAMNPAFEAEIEAAAEGGLPLMLLCRSGVRSVAAARRATELGLAAYNILGGFEGDPDDQAQRGHKNGWRRAGLPWRQN